MRDCFLQLKAFQEEEEMKEEAGQLTLYLGAQWLSGRVLDWRLRGCGFFASPVSLPCVLEQEH